jgi:calcineurin-like phosphoesterase family protein
MLLIYINNESIISSDWHVLHRNIYWFLPEQRKLLSACDVTRGMSYIEYLRVERCIYNNMLDNVRNVVEDYRIKRFFMLGDFVFGLNKSSIANKIIAELDKSLPVIYEIFRYLKSKGVRCIFIFGNHDDFKLKNKKAIALYEFLFDDIEFYFREANTIYTHFPLGYSIANDKTKCTMDEKYYRMNKVFYRLDRKLLGDINGKKIINYHGHIHAGAFVYPYESVEYKNVAIDASQTSSALLSGHP